MGAEHSFRGRDPGNDVVNIRHSPIGGVTNCHAVTVQQAATSGEGSALNIESRNDATPVAVLKGPGDLLQLKDAAGVSKLLVSQSGTVTAAGVALPTAAEVDAGDTAWHSRQLPPLITQKALYTSTGVGGTATLTLAQTTTPTSGYVKYAPALVTLSGSGNTADTRGPFTYAADEIAISTQNANYVVSTSIDPHTAATPQGVLSVAFGTDADVFQVKLLPQGSTDAVRIFVDGVPVQDKPRLLTGISTFGAAGNGHLLTVDLGSSAPRRIRVELFTSRFGGIYQGPTYDLWKVGLPGPKIAVLGDSTSGGSGVNTGGSAGTWFNFVCDAFGWENRWNQSRGGTGFITANSPFAAFGDRVAADIVGKGFDIVIVDGGYNDASTDQATFTAAVTATLGAIQAGLPDAWVIGVGCYSTSGSWPPYAASPTAAPLAGSVTKDAWQQGVFRTLGVPYVSQLTGEIRDASWNLVDTIGPWMTGSGRVGTTSGFGSADRFLGDGASDAIHPNDLGHKVKGAWMATALRKLMAV